MSNRYSTIISNDFKPKAHNFKDITGQVFNSLTVIGIAGRDNHGRILWNCVCVCGNALSVRSNNLIKDNTKSCGCLQHKRLGISLKHGEMVNGKPTPEYTAFIQAKSRCKNTNNTRYADYGGRGILFKFTSFEEFLAEIGRRPSAQHSLDRKDNDGHYEKGNVKWSTPTEQANNRRPRKKTI